MADPTDDRVTDETRASETLESQSDHEADEAPTPEEAEAAEAAASEAPDVSESYKDAADKGVNAKGEGRIE